MGDGESKPGALDGSRRGRDGTAAPGGGPSQILKGDASVGDLFPMHGEHVRGLLRGFLSLYVLKLLSQRPHYGNEIIAEIRQSSAGHWCPSAGALYPLLRKLEEDGFVRGAWESTERRPRRFYELTDAGSGELARMLESTQREIDLAIHMLSQHRRFLFGDFHDGQDRLGR